MTPKKYCNEQFKYYLIINNKRMRLGKVRGNF